MELQKSIVLPVVLSTLITVVIVGSVAYYIGANHSANQPRIRTTATLSPSVASRDTLLSSSTPVPSATPIIDTTTWKTYNDTKGNFNFKYPNDWTVYPVDRQNLSLSTLFLYPSTSSLDPTKRSNGTIDIKVLSNPNNLSLKDFDTRTDLGGEYLFQSAKHTEDITLANTRGVKFSGLNGLYGDITTVALSANQKIYEITDYIYDHPYDPNSTVISGVLQTFKFSQ